MGIVCVVIGVCIGGALTGNAFGNSNFENVSVGATSKPISWGLGGYGKGRVPTPPSGSMELLKKYDGLYFVDSKDNDSEAGGEQSEQKKVYITFDLGYEAGHTDKVLDVLKANDIKAVFFLCGHYLNSEELVARMINDGHMIGNHTNKHKDLPTLGEDAITADIAEFNTMFGERYGELYGKPLTLFRPGKGRMCERTVRIASEQGLRTVMWSSAIVDWGKEPINAQKSADKVMERIHDGNIMLFHISNAGMPTMLEVLIPKVKGAGYEFGDVWEM